LDHKLLALTLNTPKRPLAVSVVILFLAALIGANSGNPPLILACGLVITLMVNLLWGMGEPPVLLMAAGLQASQVVVLPLYASIVGVPLQDLSKSGFGDLTSGVWTGLTAMVFLVVGMWCGRSNMKRLSGWIQIESKAWVPRNAFAFCLAMLALSNLFETVGGMASGLRQPAVALSQVQWVGVFILTCVCFGQKRGFVYLVIILIFELLVGFSGFFADFKMVFLVVFLGIFAVHPKLKLESTVAAVVLAGSLLILGIFWSAVKSDYRNYVSAGSFEQVVRVPFQDRLQYLFGRALNADSQMMSEGFESLIFRLAYIELLAATISNVPEFIPFQEGTQISTTILHVLEPRLLFPDKPNPPSDTEIATRYSGIRLNDVNYAVNTSISLGYVAELYVDFGYPGIVVGTFLLGLAFGFCVRRILMYRSLPFLVNSGLTVILMMPFIAFEESLLKVVGGFLTMLIMIVGLRRFLPQLLSKFSPRRLAVGAPYRLTDR
jgi:hypothetical protein